MFMRAPVRKGREKLETNWESGVYLGVHDKSQELIMGTSKGVIKGQEFRRKGSE